jgi:alkylhydroperoxidase family enzyme
MSDVALPPREEKSVARIAVPAEHADDPLRYARQNMSPEMSAAMAALSKAVYGNSILSLREFEAARARVALINGCEMCQRFRSAQDVPGYLGEDAEGAINTHGPAPDEPFYRDILQWRDAPHYSVRERVAVEFAERFSLAPEPLRDDEEFWSRAQAVFTDPEIYDLTIAVASWVAGGRFAHVLGFDRQVSCAVN